MTHEETKARELLASIYEKRRDAVRVSASWLATEAMLHLDPARSSHPLEYVLAHLQLRQLARALLAKRHEPKDDADAEQHDLWPQLQSRYPVVRTTPDQEPEYILLEHMTAEDIVYNVNRLRLEADAKMRHADALEAWGADRLAA